MTGTTTPSLRVARSRVFSLAPTFGERREDNRIRLRLFCFLPVNPTFVAAFAALKVSLWRRIFADATGIFILTKRQQAKPVFSSCSFFALKVRFRGAKTYYMNFFTFHYNL